MTKNGALVVGVVAVALSLAACSPPAGPSASPGPGPTVTVTVTPSPVAAPRGPDYGFTFFKEAQMGSTFDQMGVQLHMPMAAVDYCAWYGAVWNTETALTYAFTNPKDPASGVTFFYAYKYSAPDGAPFPRNAEGVGLGSTQAQVVAAFPSAVVGGVEDPAYGHIVTITVDDPDSDSKYAYGISAASAVVDLLQWGPGAGNLWSYPCDAT